MRSIICSLLIGLVAGISVASDTTTPDIPSNRQHQEWLVRILKEIETIEVGMTRNDLLKIFETEGGLSHRIQRTFVHRKSPFIKVDVTFKPVGETDNRLDDKIMTISKPYLEWTIFN